METMIQVNNLVKYYGTTKIIKDISFSVRKGEIVALLGINGAGKTTTLECIEGIRRYSGNITLNGTIGVQLQSTSLPGSIRAIEAYQLFCKWKKKKIDLDLFNTFVPTELKHKQYREMSIGQKRRLHLVLALIGDPDIIFLDEPTAGLDVEGRITLHSHIRSLKEQGKTIIMASHDMAEVESLCDRIVILKEGNTVFEGTTSELTSLMEVQRKIHIKTDKPLENTDYIQGYWVYTSSNIGETLLEILEKCKISKNTILDIKIETATLEQGFMNIAKEV